MIAALARLAARKVAAAQQEFTLRRALGKPLLDTSRVVGADLEANAPGLCFRFLIRHVCCIVRTGSFLRRPAAQLVQSLVHLRPLPSFLYAEYRGAHGFFQARSASIGKRYAQVYCYAAKKAGNSCLFSFHSKSGWIWRPAIAASTVGMILRKSAMSDVGFASALSCPKGTT